MKIVFSVILAMAIAFAVAIVIAFLKISRDYEPYYFDKEDNTDHKDDRQT